MAFKWESTNQEVAKYSYCSVTYLAIITKKQYQEQAIDTAIAHLSLIKIGHIFPHNVWKPKDWPKVAK